MDKVVKRAWRFRVTCPHADRVFLVQTLHGGGNTWIPMVPMGFDVWELGVGLSPGRYQFSYFTAEGETYFNGGSYGLTVVEPDEADPGVVIEPTEQPQPA